MKTIKVLWFIAVALLLVASTEHQARCDWQREASITEEDLYAIWGSSGANVFAVGASGTILNYNGNRWSVMSSGTSGNLAGVWGSSTNNVFAVGIGGTILHYNGSSWAPLSSGTSVALSGVWGSSGTNVFAVGGLAPSCAIMAAVGHPWKATPQSFCVMSGVFLQVKCLP